MKKFIDGFEVAENKTHVAMVTFANKPDLHFDLTDEYDADTLKIFVDRVNHGGGQTYIDKALELANREVFNQTHGWRPEVTSVNIKKMIKYL